MYSSIWTYPWDFADEGIDTIFARVADAGLNGVSLATAYHTVRTLNPHNPKRAVYHGEGGVLYFQPEAQAFTECRIQPVLSNLLQGGDILTQVCEAAHKQNLRVHAWTVLHHNTRLGTAYPECSLENAFGDRYPFGLCPANPDVRAYTTALVRSLAARDDLDIIELESLGYMGIDHTGHHSKQGLDTDPLHRFLLSLCFCPDCMALMGKNGVDPEKARHEVVQEIRGFFGGHFQSTRDDVMDAFCDVIGDDQAEGILAAREEAVFTLLEELYWLIRKPQRLSIMVAGSPLSTGAQVGLTLSEAREYTDILLTQAFNKEVEPIREAIADIAVRRGSTPLYAGLQAIAPFVQSERDMVTRVQTAYEAGAEGVQFYHYGLMPLQNLAWIRTALVNL